MTFENRITRLPIPLDPVRGRAALEAMPALDGKVARLIEGAAGSSPYLATLIEREADWLAAEIAEGQLSDPVTRETRGFENMPPDVLAVSLRRAKRRIALLTGLADLGGVWCLEDVTRILSDFADRATDLALLVHVAQ